MSKGDAILVRRPGPVNGQRALPADWRRGRRCARACGRCLGQHKGIESLPQRHELGYGNGTRLGAGPDPLQRGLGSVVAAAQGRTDPFFAQELDRQRSLTEGR
jgi:hypothetical protein